MKTKLFDVGFTTKWEPKRKLNLAGGYDSGQTQRVVTVHAGSSIPTSKSLKIRSLTARAAARRYIRNNLTGDLAKIDLEYDNFAGPGLDLSDKRPNGGHADFEQTRLRIKRATEVRILIHK